MSDYKKFGDAAWDRFFEFLDLDEDRPMSDVDDELSRRGIDATPTINKVLGAVRAAKAREALERARQERPRALERLANIPTPSTGSLRDRIKDLIAGRLAATTQAAYFRKLEQAATDDDLRSLLADVERLRTLEEDDTSEGD